MLNYNDVNENREVSMPEEMCLTSQYRFAFDKKKGWIQTTRSGNRVYANRHVETDGYLVVQMILRV